MSYLKLSLIAFSVTLFGCATDSEFYSAQVAVAQANANASRARTEALLELSRGGSDTAKVAAAFGLAFDQITNKPMQVQQAPNQALQWASVLAGPVASVWLGKYARDVAVNNSNNNAQVSMNTNSTMAGIAGAGIAGAVTGSANGLTSIENVANSGFLNIRGTAESGFVSLENVTTKGYDSMLELGTQGFNGMQNIAPQLYPISIP